MTDIDLNFAKETALKSDVDLFACYQCGKCTNGCPVTFSMDYHPHQVIRLVQIGLKDEIKGARTIWVCAACETCFTRCPNEIKIADLMDYLKGWVLSEGEKPVEGAVTAFHRSFLNNKKRRYCYATFHLHYKSSRPHVCRLSAVSAFGAG